ncbi:MAG: hypothetical protein WD096_05970 [Actinomycetota bacterium]
MHPRSTTRTFRSPAVSTVFAIVFGLGGLAIAGAHTENRGEAYRSTERELGNGGDAEASGRTRGAQVSAFARRTGLEGWRKGAGVSALASLDRSQAGEHGPHAGEEPGDRANPEQAQNERADGRPLRPNPPNVHAEGRATPPPGTAAHPARVNG